MRYQVGQIIYVVAFTFAGQSYSQTHPRIPHRAEGPEKMHFKKLTVTEHHRVPDYWLPLGEKTCDGYVLTDENGKVFHNQYPMAVYGQVSDFADRWFTAHAADREEAKRLIAADKDEPVAYILVEDINDMLSESFPGSRVASPLLKNLVEIPERFHREFEAFAPGFKLERKPIWSEHPDILATQVVLKQEAPE